MPHATAELTVTVIQSELLCCQVPIPANARSSFYYISAAELPEWPAEDINLIRIYVARVDRVAPFSVHDICGMACRAAAGCAADERSISIDYVNGFGALKTYTQV